MKTISEMRKIGASLDRAGMSEMAIDCIEKWDGSYRGVMKLCGQLSEIKRMATCDDYWSEQVTKGVLDIDAKTDALLKALENDK